MLPPRASLRGVLVGAVVGLSWSCNASVGGRGGGGGPPATPPGTWTDDGTDIQDDTPWGSAGPGVGAPEPDTYLGTNSDYDPGCYRYFSANGTGDGLTKISPMGDPAGTINAICSSQTERAKAQGGRFCLKRGDEFRGTPDPRSHSLFQPAFCDGISIEDYGDQRLPRPRIMGSRIVTGTWTPTGAGSKVYRIDLSSLLQPGYSWQYGGQTYTDEERVEQVFLDGAEMVLARHPNFGQGYANPTFNPRREPTANSMLYVEVPDEGRRAFRDSKLPTTSLLQNPADWTGAHIHYKDATWIMDGTVVTGWNAADHELTTRQLVAGNDEAGKGYFLNDALAALDAEREWYYSPREKVLYLWAPGGVDPTSHRVDVSFFRANTPSASWDLQPVERRGVDAFGLQYAKGVALRRLDVRHFSGNGVRVGAPGVVVEDCAFEGIGETGISLGFNTEEAANLGLGRDPIRLSRNRIRNATCNGIVVDSPGAVVENSSLLEVGTLELFGSNGLGLDGNGCGLTVHETGSGIKTGEFENQTARYNFLERIGHNGIAFRGPSSVVEGNVIHLASVTKGDSGGVSSWAWDNALSAADNFARPGVQGSVVRRNVLVEVIGSAEGVLFPGTALGNGFFIDYGCQGVTLSDNVIGRTTTQGILLTIDRNQTVERNTIFGTGMSGSPQLDMGDCQLSSCPYSVHDNLLVSTAPFEQSMRMFRLADLTSDGNRYLNPFPVPASPYQVNMYDAGLVCALSARTGVADLADCHTLDSWRTASGQDGSSAMLADYLWRSEYPSDYLSGDLLPNPGFDADVAGWDGWRCMVAWDAGELSARKTADSAGALSRFAAEKGARYEVRLEARGASALQPRLTVGTNTQSWGELGDRVPSGLSSFRFSDVAQETPVIFGASTDDPAAYFHVETAASQVWLDDVHLRKVETYRVPSGVVLRPGDAVPPAARLVMYVNPSTSPQSVDLGAVSMLDDAGATVSGSFSLPGLSSRVLVAGRKLGLGKASRDLGTVAVGQVARQRPVLASIGARPLGIASVGVKEAGTPFAVTADCNGQTLAPSAVCAFDLTFTPTVAGEFSATLVVTSDDMQAGVREVALHAVAQ